MEQRQKKHRKLFPMLATETNKTIDCSIGICDPTICPYNCYQEPDYYYNNITPQHAPWSSPQPIKSPSPSISAVYPPSQNSSAVDAITIITITGAVLAILLTGFFLAAKFVKERPNRVNRQERYNSDDDNTVEEAQFQQVDHPIWLIRTTGLQQSVINSITICSYKRGDGLIERTDCPVCLNEFEEEESLRLLPKCNHAFHISCIDTWLRSHTNCPLCRAGITISTTYVPVVVTPGRGSGSSLESHGDDENRENTEQVTGDEKETQNKPIEDQASGSGGYSGERLSSFDSVDSNSEKAEDIWTNVSKTTGSSSVPNKNKSLVFPL